MESVPIRTLFLDIGGVLLTNGWDTQARRLAATTFNIEDNEIEERHHLIFDTFELGKTDLDEYIERVIFYKPRLFSRADFKEFVFNRSQSYPDMLQLIREIKDKYQLQVVAVSNEGRELAYYRTRKFNLKEIFDTFIVSSFIHLRKPDLDIFRIALDVSQSDPAEVLYIDDRLMFIEVAQELGIAGIHHVGYDNTRQKLANWGLKA